ncbi:MAG: AtpZ/AtpI family protein [Alphaproteobacteria bacterium]
MVKNTDEELFKKIDSLGDRINSARNEYDKQKEQHEGKAAEEEAPEIRLGRRVASLFLGHVIAGLVLGILADKYLGLAPWGLMLCLILGLAGGVYRAQDTLQK